MKINLVKLLTNLRSEDFLTQVFQKLTLLTCQVRPQSLFAREWKIIFMSMASYLLQPRLKKRFGQFGNGIQMKFISYWGISNHYGLSLETVFLSEI